MEIISYVLEGELAHKDSMGNGSVIAPGRRAVHERGHGRAPQRVQRRRRRTPVHFYQIWIMPNAEGAPPRYDQKRFDDGARTGKPAPGRVGRRRATARSPIRQDVKVYASILEPGGRCR